MAGSAKASYKNLADPNGPGRTIMRMSTGEKSIVLGLTRPHIYYNCNQFDPQIVINTKFWNEIIVHHEGRYKRSQILSQFVKYFSQLECYPVAYRSDVASDSFYVRVTEGEMKILFSNNLKMIMKDGKLVYLTIKINIAPFEVGQITPEQKILNVVSANLDKKQIVNHFFRVLSFNCFSEKPALKDIYISFAHESAFYMFCETLLKLLANTSINGLRLQNNAIKSLKPLELLKDGNIEYLDLSFNSIESVDELKYLSILNLKELNLYGNSITEQKNFDYKIREYLPNLRVLDSKDRNPKEKNPIFNEQLSGDVITKNDLMGLNLGKYRPSQKWHQIAINHNGRCNKAQILQAIFKLTDNQDFYPTYYKETDTKDIFFVRNCLDAIESLCQNDLTLTVGDNLFDIPITITMNALTFKKGEEDTPNSILDILNERYNMMDKILNLDNFASSLDYKDIIMDMSNPKALGMVLTLASRKYSSTVVHISMRNNNIKTAKGLNALAWLKSLKTINLGCNAIEDWNEFNNAMPKKMKITEIYFEGNPVCKTFKNAVDYVKSAVRMFPELEKLDGHPIVEKMFVWHRNYICDLKYYDFVDYFIKQYFKTFDSVQRLQIKDLYSPNACFTLSMNFDPNKVTIANSTRINRYRQQSRNILKLSNVAQCMTNVFIGHEAILNFFSDIPATEHDFHTFSIDLLNADKDMITLTVNGTYREMGASLLENELWFGFVRTFVLRPIASGLGIFKNTTEYQICNEQLNIFSLSIIQIKSAFHVKNPTNINEELDFTEEEKNHLVKIFQDISNLKTNWCIKCLQKANWVFTDALENFTKLYEQNKIPKIGFMGSSSIDLL